MKRIIPLCVALAALVSPVRAIAQLAPIEDRREINARATYVGVTQYLEEFPAAPFAFFNSYVAPYVPHPDPEGPGSCTAFAFQTSQFWPAGIAGNGTASGSWNILPDASYGGLSLTHFKFQTSVPLDYQLDAWVEPGDFVGSGEFLLEARPSGVQLHQTFDGEIHTTGRLAPGLYAIEGRSSFTTGVESFTAGTYAFQFTVSQPQSPLIVGQPVGLVTPCDASADFSVTTGPPAASLTFQWRRNGVPLVNGSHVSGATSQSLTIHDPCYPDTGYYDVLVSNGAVIEPSSLARLEIEGGTTDVEPGAGPLARTLQLAGPSPFTRETAFRIAAGATAAIGIYDVSGARVRKLEARAEGGVVTWDGRNDAGARARAGVYFARLENAGPEGVCRVVKLP